MRFTGWNKSLLDGKENFCIGSDGEGNPIGRDPLKYLVKATNAPFHMEDNKGESLWGDHITISSKDSESV